MYKLAALPLLLLAGCDQWLPESFPVEVYVDSDVPQDALWYAVEAAEHVNDVVGAPQLEKRVYTCV